MNLPRTKAPASTTQSRGGFCRRLNDCMIMGSAVSTNQPYQQQQQQYKSKLEQQVADLESEVAKQKELRMMYRKRMERTHDYLKYCLQVAQDNGFLDLIINKNKNDHDQQECPLNSTINLSINASPQLSSPVHQHADLTALVGQAKMNGWYIEHNEVLLNLKALEIRNHILLTESDAGYIPAFTKLN
ncbi:conserved hypothetical protein [Ricinus communis]|uniref:Uncharacterized protein n=1 Tax=Ricinus communis TaxID=3988 RepID=B9RQU9_RICCO|nr:conserved hypothetical protein [Ricinus communis]